MRRILRAAGRTGRVFLWIVKGLLLLLAVGALVLWPVSKERLLRISGERWVLKPYLNQFALNGRCQGGRISIGWEWGRWYYEVAESGLPPNAGWTWTAESEPLSRRRLPLPFSWGPLDWSTHQQASPQSAFGFCYFSAPCWLIALLLALWPLASIALLIRRRRKRRRLARVGCCLHCGYDLRATAEPNGPLLARCPECGAESAVAKTKLTAETQSTQRIQ